MSSTNSLQSRVIETKLLKWKDFQFIQPDNFKELSADASDKLRKSMLENHFTQPFYVWVEQNSNIIYCLDGYHRVKELKVLEEAGLVIPQTLPATLVECADQQEAAKLVLLYSSQYAQVTPVGFSTFLNIYNLDEQLLKMQVSIPGITDVPIVEELPFPDELTGDPKNKPAVMKITFKNADDLEEAKPTLEKVLEEIAEGYIISVSAGEI